MLNKFVALYLTRGILLSKIPTMCAQDDNAVLLPLIIMVTMPFFGALDDGQAGSTRNRKFNICY